MNELSDQQLLRDYAENRRETAFAELVYRHIDLVYSAALRMVRDMHLAQDVTQAVFVALAGNASQLAGHPVLSGWLHCTARNLAAKAVRSDVRRRAREQEAVAMNELLSAESEPSWEAIAPHLDAALGELNAVDRDALLLRYFEKKSAPEMAGLLGISDEAAQKRVSRAVERLRELFSKRGVTVGAGGLAMVITANAVQAAPVGLGTTISAAALAGSSLSTTTLIAATKTIAMTTLQKTLVAATVAVLAGAGAYEVHQTAQLQQQNQALQQQLAPLAGQIQELQSEREAATNQLAQLREDDARLNQNQKELVELRGEVGLLRYNQSAASAVEPAANPLSQPDGKPELPPADDIGRKLGIAVVRGDAGALDNLSALAKTELAGFNTNSAGLDDSQRGELHRQTFAPLFSAFQVIQDAALQGNQTAIEAVIKGTQIPELQGHSVQCIGALAGNGNNDALDVLLNYPKYGFLLSEAVGALQTAAGNGNQPAIDFMSAVTKDENNAPLWFMAVSSLAKPASAGNSAAIDALIGLSGNTDPSVRNAVISGLKGAAAIQNAKAVQALQAMGAQ